MPKLLDKYGINNAVVNMYRDKSGKADLKRMQDSGFEVIAHSFVDFGDSGRPSKDYYYMKKVNK